MKGPRSNRIRRGEGRKKKFPYGGWGGNVRQTDCPVGRKNGPSNGD